MTTDEPNAPPPMTGFALTVFLGAFLLFQVQPVMGRFILPWFGGASAVWTTCLLFFQVVLLAGYGYAHCLSRRPARVQAVTHLGLLVLSLVLLPIVPGAEWKPAPDDPPVGRILLLLLSTVGIQFALLASTGPLVQHWFVRTHPGRSPYRLYALSNTASLLALLSYPIVVEPLLPLARQASLWGWGYGLFALLAAWCGFQAGAGASRAQPGPVSPEAATAREAGAPGAPLAPRTIVLWLALAAAGSTMLLATTNQLTREVASVPFLWVLPLSVYLATFAICFDRERWYSRRVIGPALAVTAGLTVALLLVGSTGNLWIELAIYLAALAACCMACHGELYRARPAPEHLTLFYLMVAAGGALGGGFVILVAPLLFRGFWELHLALGGSCFLVMLTVLHDRRAAPDAGRLATGYAVTAALLLLVAGIALIGDPPARLGDVPAGWLEIRRRFVAVWRGYWPYLTLAGAGGAVVVAAAFKDLALRRRGRPPVWYRGALRFCVFALGGALVLEAKANRDQAIHAERNFYGVVRVVDRRDSVTAYRGLIDGTTAHGRQYLDPAERRRPLAYYDPASGVGLVFGHRERLAAADPGRGPFRVGLVGLGAGTLAAYGTPGDVFRFYEINPAVAAVARRYFTYLDDSAARIEIVLGDGRIRLEEELRRDGGQAFDLLIIDAFTSDAIPAHLLTEQSTELYLRHLKPDGLLLFHVSNRYVNLRPVIRGLTRRFGLQGRWILRGGQVDPGVLGSSWMIVGRPGQPIFADQRISETASAFPMDWLPVSEATRRLGLTPAEIERRIAAGLLASIPGDPERLVGVETDPPPALWTDDYSSLWPLLRLR